MVADFSQRLCPTPSRGGGWAARARGRTGRAGCDRDAARGCRTTGRRHGLMAQKARHGESMTNCAVSGAIWNEQPSTHINSVSALVTEQYAPATGAEGGRAATSALRLVRCPSSICRAPRCPASVRRHSSPRHLVTDRNVTAVRVLIETVRDAPIEGMKT